MWAAAAAVVIEAFVGVVALEWNLSPLSSVDLIVQQLVPIS